MKQILVLTYVEKSLTDATLTAIEKTLKANGVALVKVPYNQRVSNGQEPRTVTYSAGK